MNYASKNKFADCRALMMVISMPHVILSFNNTLKIKPRDPSFCTKYVRNTRYFNTPNLKYHVAVKISENNVLSNAQTKTLLVYNEI